MGAHRVHELHLGLGVAPGVGLVLRDEGLVDLAREHLVKVAPPERPVERGRLDRQLALRTGRV